MFNPNARWDRKLPRDDNPDEKIPVEASFNNGSVAPRSFRYAGSVHEIKEITFRWKERAGSEQFYYFNVTDGADVYKIYFGDRSLIWRISRVE
ncbi:MAG: hypothetical protein WCY23_01865 [Candidatus Omnitrophota bacterium]